jgi:hypothetical protein
MTTELPQKGVVASTKTGGMLMLAMYLLVVALTALVLAPYFILIGITVLFHTAIAPIVMGILALAAGTLTLIASILALLAGILIVIGK